MHKEPETVAALYGELEAAKGVDKRYDQLLAWIDGELSDRNQIGVCPSDGYRCSLTNSKRLETKSEQRAVATGQGLKQAIEKSFEDLSVRAVATALVRNKSRSHEVSTTLP